MSLVIRSFVLVVLAAVTGCATGHEAMRGSVAMK